MKNRFIITKEGREFKQNIQNFIKKEYPNFECIKDNVKIHLEFGFCDNRRKDLDNLFKSLLDCLNKLILEDDSQIFEIYSSKKLGQDQDYILMEIWKI